MNRLVATLLALMTSASMAKVIQVKPGTSIQAAVLKAESGDTVEVLPGTYKESVVVEKPNIKLVGKPVNGELPVIEGENTRNDGIVGSGSHFEVANFVVRNFKGNGVMTQGGDHIRMHHLVVQNTGIYGIYPTRGDNVVVEDTVSSGIADAAIYIGMCTNVDVRRNEAFESVAGIEIENSSHVIVEDNLVHNNAGGILVFTLPGLPVKGGENTIVRNNMVIENNHVNFGPAGSVVGNVPSGSGIILLAADKVIIENNIIRGNKTGGIILSDMDYISDSSAPDKAVDPQYDDNQILNNFYYRNGEDPAGKVKLLLLAKHFALKGGDVLANGSGRRNCLIQNGQAKTYGTKTFQACSDKATSTNITTMTNRSSGKQLASMSPLGAHPDSPGKVIFENVCAGCHGMGIRLIGPPIQDLQTKYKDNPDGIVAFAKNPKKVRDGYPQMPAQTHISQEKLKAAAAHILSLK